MRLIQSAILSREESLRKHTHHAEDVVICRLIVCVSGVSNHHQTRGGFRPPSVTLPLCLLHRLHKLPRRPSARAASRPFHRSLLKRSEVKEATGISLRNKF